ncbi:MAG: hypothetical protein ACXVDA_13110 [Ktedonobacterales bacterium]
MDQTTSSPPQTPHRARATSWRYTQTAPVNGRLYGRALVIVRAAWLIVAVLTSGLYLASTLSWLGEVRGPCPPGMCIHGQVPPAGVRALADLHLSVGFYGWYTFGLSVLFAGGFAVIAVLLFWHRSRDPLALYISLTLLVFGTVSFNYRPITRLVASSPGWKLPVAILEYLGVAAVGVFGYVFPDGRFVPRWTVLGAVAFALWFLPAYLWPDSPFSMATWPGVALFATWAFFLGAAGATQIYRYRRVSTPTQRQQTKWVVFGIIAASVCYYAGQLVIFFLDEPPLITPRSVLADLTGGMLIQIGFLLIPICFGIAILRHRLFDIDLIIQRTLVYTLLAASLTLLYEGGVLVVEKVLLAFTGQVSFAAEVVAAFGVGALAERVYRRIERGIARVFNRPKYEAERQIAAFSKQLRREWQVVPRSEEWEEAVEQRIERVWATMWRRSTRTSADVHDYAQEYVQDPLFP